MPRGDAGLCCPLPFPSRLRFLSFSLIPSPLSNGSNKQRNRIKWKSQPQNPKEFSHHHHIVNSFFSLFLVSLSLFSFFLSLLPTRFAQTPSTTPISPHSPSLTITHITIMVMMMVMVVIIVSAAIPVILDHNIIIIMIQRCLGPTPTTTTTTTTELPHQWFRTLLRDQPHLHFKSTIHTSRTISSTTTQRPIIIRRRRHRRATTTNRIITRCRTSFPAAAAAAAAAAATATASSSRPNCHGKALHR